jgi:hypothetical protein
VTVTEKTREELLVGLAIVATVAFVTYQKGLDGRSAALWIGVMVAAWISSVVWGRFAERRWPWARDASATYIVGMTPALVLAALFCIAIGEWLGAAVLAPTALFGCRWMLLRHHQESRGP